MNFGVWMIKLQRWSVLNKKGSLFVDLNPEL